MKQNIKRFWAPLLLATLCLPAVRAQQQTPPPTTNPTSPTAPIPAAGSQDTKQQEPASPVQVASPTVTGAIAPSLGETGDTQSQFTGGLIFSELFDSNYQNLSGAAPGWNELTTVGGHIELHRVGASTDLLVRYVGGGYIDPQNSSFDTSYHQLEIGETLNFRRWSLKLDDVVSYLPGSAFGFGGNGLSGGPAVGLVLVNPFELPSQSILTDQGKRLSNSALAQVQVNATPRSSWTFTGSYGLLDFTDTSDLNSTDAAFSAGYNYQLSARDTLGVSYGFNAIRFSPAIESINDNTVQVSYGHHISNRLVLQAGVGPDIYTLTPFFGPSLGAQITFAANASLIYQIGQTTLSGSFSRGLTGGAGILEGASSNLVNFTASHKFGQRTTITGSVGYAANSSLPQAAVASTNYNTVNASVGFNRQLSRSFSVNASYNLLHQTTNALACGAVVGCAGPVLRHQIWVGFSWDMHPVPLR
jgi:hypothetical protein